MKYQRKQHRNRKTTINVGITLVEVIVILFAIAALAALGLPAIQSMREQSRQTKCQYRLTQIHTGLASYQVAQQHYPAGTINPTSPVRSDEVGFHHNWVSAILPKLDLMPLYEQIDFSVSVYDSRNDDVRRTPLPAVRCPSAFGMVSAAISNYAGNQGSKETAIDQSNDGVLFLNTTLTPDQITNGLDYTLFVSEKLSQGEEDLGWLSGTRATLRNAGHPLETTNTPTSVSPQESRQSDLFVGGFSSAHPNGAFLLMGSGRVRFFATDGDLQVLQQFAKRSDQPLEEERLEGKPAEDAE
ncbi:MAG: DUF1559 domain-containing protein [Pirellulaceae bacterium]